MTRLLRICSSVFLISCLCTKGYADEHFPFLAEISKKSVNIRAGANTNFEKIDQLTQGDEVIVVSKSYDWYKVRLPLTTKVFIRADYLKILQNSTAELTGDKVNIRAFPESDSSSLGIIAKGSIVKTITQTNGWWQIEPPVSAGGWIRQDFLTFKSAVVPDSLPGKIQPKVFVKQEDDAASSIEVKGRLMSLSVPQGDIRYELRVDNKTLYYLTAPVDISRFRGAVVLIRGVAVQEKSSYEHPLLRISNISLLL